jgi:cell shape-determining protein MreC
MKAKGKSGAEREQLKEKIAGLERYLSEHEELERELEASGESQVSLTDPEAG